jgi:hypothetical protein
MKKVIVPTLVTFIQTGTYGGNVLHQRRHRWRFAKSLPTLEQSLKKGK